MDVVCALTLQSIVALFYGMPDYSTYQGNVVGMECSEKTIYRCNNWLLYGM
jgi:hypothetical protein